MSQFFLKKVSKKYHGKNACPICYAPSENNGAILLRIIDSDNKIVELKQMSVLPEYQGKGYGRLLLNHAVAYAKDKQYYKICLDTRKQFSAAQHLYRSSGFQETKKYNDNDRAELYFELVL